CHRVARVALPRLEPCEQRLALPHLQHFLHNPSVSHVPGAGRQARACKPSSTRAPVEPTPTSSWPNATASRACPRRSCKGWARWSSSWSSPWTRSAGWRVPIRPWCAPTSPRTASTCSSRPFRARGMAPMTDRTPRPAPRVPAVAVLACGLLLSVLAGFGGVAAVLAGLVAQPLLGLGLAAQRGSRPLPSAPRPLLASLRPLLLLWGAGLAVAALLLAWPLQALRGHASLGAALGTSTMAALLVLALWRSWPVWRALEAEGGALGEAWRRLPRQQVDGWAGLGPA